MNQKDRDVKINWFCLRTGCSKQTAKEYLTSSKWKLEVAIRLLNIDRRYSDNAGLAKW